MSEKPTTTTKKKKKEQQKKTKKAAKAPKEKTKRKEEEEQPKATKPARVERQKKPAKQTKPRKAEKEEVEEKKDIGDQPPVVKKDVAPQAPVPTPAVSVRHEDLMKMRKARGFSMPELSSAGLSMVSVKRWGVPFDRRRKSMLLENEEKLKAWLKSPRGANRSGRSGRKSGSRSRKR